MNDAFAQIVGPVFQHVIDLQQQLRHDEHPPLADTRHRLLSLLGEAEQKAAVSREQAHDFALARYALVYWIDEVLINSSWSYSGAWRDQILEWDFYQERLGGEQFYDKAREAESLTSTDPLEVFYLCVALGFQGKYGSNRLELQRWGERVYGRIASGSKPPERFLPDEARETEPIRPLPGKSVLLAVSILVSATALITLACFILATHAT